MEELFIEFSECESTTGENFVTFYAFIDNIQEKHTQNL